MNMMIQKTQDRQIAIWLFIGVGMIVIQVLLGGITRLTESGLSITEWKPVTGALPPLNQDAWLAEFERYKSTDQFKYVHQSFSLHDFKFIFFWEWFHRLWARLMGLVFVIGFMYFLVKGKFKKGMILPLVILFLLGALQGAIGWIMVKSGLVPEKYFVGHIELAVHFMTALFLLSYTLWFALSLFIKPGQHIANTPLKRGLMAILSVLIFQLVYGAFMAGLKAGQSAPTWPGINGHFIPPSINELSPWAKNLLDNNLAIQFIHRSLAFVLFVLTMTWYFKSKRVDGMKLFFQMRSSFALIIILQITLGIFTVINANVPARLVWLGVMHQTMAMLLLMCVIVLQYITRKKVRAVN
jgi:cytochrome c oxidase assembly protein subunit 15